MNEFNALRARPEGRIGRKEEYDAMFKFTIRELLWLMVVLGLGFALWIERSRNGVARQQLQTLVDVLESCDVQAEVAPGHVIVTGPDFAAHQIIGEPDQNQRPVVLDGTRITPSIHPVP